MPKIKIKKNFLTLISAVLLITVFNIPNLTTSAKFNPINRKICSLAVAPYNKASSPILGLAADQYLNYLDNETCNKFVKLYGNAYSPQPPKIEDNPVKPGSEDKNVPIIRHDHSYFNDTIHDENFYYKAFVDRFEITMQSDTFNNVDLDKVKCQTPYPSGYNTSKIAPLEDCSGNVDDLWGGTVLNKKTVEKTVGNKVVITLVITWDFAQVPNNGKFTGRPQVWADNGKNFDQGDFSDENKRKLAFNVHLPTKDNNGQIWSATTTSRVLLADLAINKANYANHKNDSCKNNDVNDTDSGWCYINPKDNEPTKNFTNEPTKNFTTETVFTTENKTFYWFDIGSVATVWRKAEPIKKECKNLLVDHPQKIYEDTVSMFKAKALNTDYNDFPGKIKYWVEPGYGEFYLIKPKNIPDNPSKYIYEATPAGTPLPFPDYTYNPANAIDPDIIIAGNSAATYIGSIINITTALGTGSFGIENLSTNLPNTVQIQDFIDKNLIEVPSWMETGLKSSVNPIDPSPADSPKGGDQFFNPKMGQNSLLAVNFGNFDIQPAITPDLETDDLTKPEPLNNFYPINSLFESITVDPGTTVYFWAKKPGKNKVHVQTVNSDIKECRRDFDIEPKPQLVCKELNLVTNTKGDLVTGQPTLININPKDTAGKKLPPATKFKLFTTTDGKFQNSAGKNLGNTALLSDFPIYLVNATKAGTVTVEMDKTDPAYAAVCAAEVKVKVSQQNQCTALSYTLVKYGDTSGTNQTTLEKGIMYKVSAKLWTTIPNENTVTYMIDNQYGVFIKAEGETVQMAIKNTLSTLSAINFDTLSGAFGATSLAYQLTVAENYPVILVTFSNPPTSPSTKTDALKIQGSGYDDPCIKYVPFVLPTEVKECKNISLDPAFNPNASNQPSINIIGDYKDHNSDIKVTITGNTTGKKPSIGKIGGTESQELIFTKADIQSNVAKSFIYNKNDYNENTDTLTLTVEAIGSTVADCKKTFTFSPPPISENGGEQPGGGKKKPKDEKPTIEKFAYPGNKEKDADDVINISNKTEHVNFVIKFNIGNKIDAVDIWDSAFNPTKPNKIYSTGLETGADGYLELENLEISLIKNENIVVDNKKKTAVTIKECEKNDKSICFTNKQIEVMKQFGKGEKITFKNLKTAENGKILITYKMSYKQRLTDAECLTLTVCGEQFINQANFESGNYKSSASTKVIAICPYILTRQGGDVFFHDVIDTGVDVAQCSEVKSCDGPCITPEPPEKKKLNETGTGDIDEKFKDVKLDLPSHDVCRYSNLGNNLEGYNNVLKNFSSTICELRADVSKAWTKKNINDSIAANVKRISRWEENLTKSSISNMTDLTNLSNQTSGVFVRKNSDLKIGSLSGYVINKNGSVPAAQTYIVIGHDLYINSDIKYAQLGLQDFTNNKNIPSAAFIVIDGDIIIDRNVKQIDGILMAVDLDGIDTNKNGDDDNTDGKVKSTDYEYTKTLTINGNLIGNVYDLFSKRRAIGDPRKDQGSVTIRYDERILLNTPPGINELINVQQAIVPN